MKHVSAATINVIFTVMLVTVYGLVLILNELLRARRYYWPSSELIWIKVYFWGSCNGVVERAGPESIKALRHLQILAGT